MKHKNLVTYKEYGIQPYINALNGIYRLISELEKRADKLYGPVLERRSKADKIRIALSILEQWKFFFNLPSSLRDMIKKKRYDGAVRDYKKGKSLMQTSFRDPTDKKPIKKQGKDSTLPENYKGVFEKVWVEVESIAADLREGLFEQLATMSNPLDTQEKIIGYLVDLDAKRDPMCVYLEKQYYYLIQRIIELHNYHIDMIICLSEPIFSAKLTSAIDVTSSLDDLKENSLNLANPLKTKWFSQYPNIRSSEKYYCFLH